MQFSPFDSQERIFIRPTISEDCFILLETKLSGKHLTLRKPCNFTGDQLTNLGCACTTPHEMQNEEHQPHDEQDVNHTGAYMKGQKSEQPKNN
jgi:hypothetical protein